MLACPVAKRLLVPAATPAQLFEKLTTTLQSSPCCVQLASARRWASPAVPKSKAQPAAVLCAP